LCDLTLTFASPFYWSAGTTIPDRGDALADILPRRGALLPQSVPRQYSRR